MPIGDSFRGTFTDSHASQLGKWYGHVVALPPNLDEHVCPTARFRRAMRRTSTVSPFRSGEVGINRTAYFVEGEHWPRRVRALFT